MKWGVRRYQNKDGTLTNAGKKRYSESDESITATSNNKSTTSSTASGVKQYSDKERMANMKKLATRNFDAARKDTELYKRYEKDVSEYEQTHAVKKWWNQDGTMSDEAKEYSKGYNKLYDAYYNESKKLRDEQQIEEKNLRKSVFLSDELTPSLQKAKQLLKDIDTMEDDMVGYKSKAYQDAYKEYMKRNKSDDRSEDDIEYGFDHYYWPSSKERKQAMSEYNKAASAVKKEYTDIVSDVGKKVVGQYSDKKLNRYQTYDEWVRDEIDDIIRFDRIEI